MSREETRSLTKRSFFVIVTALFVVIAIDLMIGATFTTLKHVGDGKIYYKFFDYGDEYFRIVHGYRDHFTTFIREYYDPLLGWNNPRSGHIVSQGCNTRWEASYNGDGSRKSCGAKSSGKYDVICVGDSFTHGNEVDDCATYPAVLQRLLNGPVGNFGVSGYDTVQSVLQYEAVLSRISPPKIAILGIMYENGRRNLNSFRPVYSNFFYSFDTFLFKPHFDGKQVSSSVIEASQTYAHYLSQASDRFVDDFWSKPKLRFPFTLSLLQALNRPHFKFRFHQRINQLVGKGIFSYDYQTPILLDSLRYCVARFIAISRDYHVIPLVVFIPPSTRDRTSPDLLIHELRARHPRVHIVNFGEHTMDWNRYPSIERCHPSAENYAEIARFIHARLKSLIPEAAHSGSADVPGRS